MNKTLLNTEVQDFITTHINTNIHTLVLKGSPFEGIDIKEIIGQIEAKKKCESKLKTWFNTPGIYFPNKLNIEQTSSETTAQLKSEFTKGQSLVDLTGGFGVDSYYFSKQFKSVIHCEMNPELAEIAAFNFEALGAKNIISQSKNGIEFLKSCQHTFDWIYVDPSRRDAQKNKKFLIEDCSPNVKTFQGLFLKYATNVLIKMSPMLDISVGLEALKHVKTIYIIAIRNEVKELLFHQEKGYMGQATIHTLNSHPSGDEHFSFKRAEEDTAEACYSAPKQFLYEPNAAVMKSGAFKLISEHFKLDKLDPHTHLYTSDERLEYFPGKLYAVSNVFSYQKKALKKAIGGLKANIKTRNFAEKPKALKTLFKLTDGGELYVFFTTSNAKKIVVECRLATV